MEEPTLSTVQRLIMDLFEKRLAGLAADITTLDRRQSAMETTMSAVTLAIEQLRLEQQALQRRQNATEELQQRLSANLQMLNGNLAALSRLAGLGPSSES
jgi:ABC-type phosphate transport system auxiliary subunit